MRKFLRVGGLDETIREYNPKTGQGNGNKFSGYTPQEFLGAVRQAITIFHDKSSWEALIRDNTALDFSWESVLPQYLELYRLAREKRQSREIPNPRRPWATGI